MRTRGGSGEKPMRLQPRSEDQVKNEKLTNATRDLHGSLEDFRDHIQKVMGIKEVSNMIRDSDRLVWQVSGDIARIEVNAHKKRIDISGKDHQVRSLLRVLEPRCLPCSDGQSSSVSTKSHTRASLGSGCAPSQVYAPSAVYAPCDMSVTAGLTKKSHGNLFQGEPPKRKVVRNFFPEGQGELELKVGDILSIDHDPDDTSAGTNRWIHGRNEKNQRGWFPSSYTKSFMEVAATTQTE